MKSSRRNNLISIFSNHPVAANLLMVMMLLAGVWALKQLNTQFFPSFRLDFVTVNTVWSGAGAGDVESLITKPLEQELRGVDFVKEVTSTSAENSSRITLEFVEDADVDLAVDRVKERVDLVALPDGAETPKISRVINYEEVARLLISGSGEVDELRVLVQKFETDLLARGIDKITVRGLPTQQIAIEVPSSELRRLGLSLDDIGRRVAAWSRDVPVGVVGRGEVSKQLRFRERRETGLGFESVPIIADDNGRLLTLGSVANIARKAKENQATLRYKNKSAVEFILYRTENSDSIKSANIFQQWLQDTRANLPSGIELVPYNETWELLDGRIKLLVNNGLGGLVLAILVLFLFMSGRVAWWTAVGIPVSFMAALAVFYLAGGSINMISLFGFIMALGIIVDDAIVVGEEAMSRYERGVRPLQSAEQAGLQMLGPVFSSSLTTIAAFMPLLLVGGIIGTIMRAIPAVVICVITASLIECFLILPGHLSHSFRKMSARAAAYRPGKIRRVLDAAFFALRERGFRPLAHLAVTHRFTTLAIAVTLLIVTAGWMQSGRINFHFFPSTESDRIFANVGMVSATPADEVRAYLDEVEAAFREVENDFGVSLSTIIINRYDGENSGTVHVELVDPDAREIRNRDIVNAWRDKLPPRPGVESLTIDEPQAGPPGRDIDIRVVGDDIARVKRAAVQLRHALDDIAGVSGVADDSPYGREQMVLALTPVAEALGLRVDDISRQLRAAYQGYEVHELSDGYDDIEVRVVLPAAERDGLAGLPALAIKLPAGNTAPLANLVTVSGERGYETIRHSDGKLAITVTANVDSTTNNANRIHDDLQISVLPKLAAEHGVTFAFGGRQADQMETLGDMQLGLILALAMIYLVLAWVFGSYGLPLIVMFIIPFGLVGAIWGHAIMGQDLSVLSLFGFFALSGVVVNDSIILVVRYKQLRAKKMPPFDAAIEAACLRLRAVLLTSLTTIGGLTPLLFETSLQAQFLIPMATSLAFGLGFATLLVLLVIPSLLLVYENAFAKFLRPVKFDDD